MLEFKKKKLFWSFKLIQQSKGLDRFSRIMREKKQYLLLFIAFKYLVSIVYTC